MITLSELKLRTIEGRIVSVRKLEFGSVLIYVEDNPPAFGQVKYDPGTNELYVWDGFTWMAAEPAIDAATVKMAPLKKTGLTFFGMPVYSSESIPAGKVLVLGKDLHAHPDTVRSARDGMQGGFRNLAMHEFLKAAKAAQNTTYTMDPRLYKAMMENKP